MKSETVEVELLVATNMLPVTRNVLPSTLKTAGTAQLRTVCELVVFALTVVGVVFWPASCDPADEPPEFITI